MKRLLSTLLVLTLLLAAGMVPAGAEGELLDGGVTNATGYPIVNEPIELEVAIWYASGVSYEYDDLAIVQKIAEDTGIQLKFRIYTEQEKVQLMYASADYPDISWRLDGSDTPKLDAIEAGDVVCLDDYMQYAPNIAALFEEYPNIKLQATNAADGRIYAFPFFEDWDSTFGLRDCTLINRVWLDELGLEIPTTLDELLEVLRAFKAAAGTGSIPENVIPYYMYYPSAIGSIFDFICSFGVYVYDSNWEAVIDQQYCYQAINPEIIEPIQYLAQMYEEGLVNQNMFTDSWNEYSNIFNSDPPVAGITAGYANADTQNYCMDGSYYPMAPVDTGNGKQPYTRTQAYGSSWPSNFMIYKTNEYPVASVRLADYLCSTEMSYNMRFGMQGYYWDYNEDGVPYIMNYGIKNDELAPYSGFNNMGFTICKCNDMINPTEEVEGSRDWAIANVYADYTVQYTYPRLPNIQLDEIENDRLSDLKTDLSACVDNYIARWIVGEGDIAEEWDAYIAEMEAIGVEEYIELQQKKLDMAYALGE